MASKIPKKFGVVEFGDGAGREVVDVAGVGEFNDFQTSPVHGKVRPCRDWLKGLFVPGKRTSIVQ